MKRVSIFAVVLVLGLFLVACGEDEPTTDAGGETETETTQPSEPEASEILVTAVEYEFDLPDTLPAGTTTFTLQNDGEEPHFIEIVELTEDAPELEKLLKMGENEIGQYFVKQHKIPTAKPGETAKKTAEIDLVTGARYAYVCFIPTKDGTPHAFLGMTGEFTVE